MAGFCRGWLKIAGYYLAAANSRRKPSGNTQSSFSKSRVHDGVGGRRGSSIVLFYAAFDLQATYLIYNNSTRYFPIRCAANEYTLGRTFLQEAYVIANYEHSNF